MKCLVTGGAGFIGSHLCDLLVNQGYEIVCLDNFITGNKKNISHLEDNPKFRLLVCDLAKPLSRKAFGLFENLNFVYHLASPASPPQYRKYSVETLMVNSFGTYQALEIARKNRASFLLASTSEVYGNPTVHPQKETYFGNVNPVGLRACYDEGKRFAESLVMEYIRKFRLKARIVRIFNTYGPRMQIDDGRVVSNFINQAINGRPLTVYGDGNQTRSFTYVSDMTDGIFQAMEKDQAETEVINLGSKDEKTINEIGKIILKLTKTKSSMVYLDKRLGEDPDRRRPDLTKAQKILDWRPKISIEDGLVRAIEYFKKL